MKKNKMMRLASAMMVTTLMTTSVISGTFAKYVTEDSASDSARVAKWGVTVAANGSLFDVAYKDAPATFTAGESVDTITVQTSDSTKLVAPGTKNENGITFTLTGVPEVDTSVQFVVNAVKDVKLPSGEYLDYTTGVSDDKFNLPSDYYPVVFTLTSGTGVVLEEGTLADIADYFTALNDVYHTNTDLATIGPDKDGNLNVTDGTYKLTWEWLFEQTTNKDLYDAADTYLGNVAAGLVTDVSALTEVAFDISITVTQVN
jgi:hypothetical protein